MMTLFEWVVGESSKDHTVTALLPTAAQLPRYTTLRGAIRRIADELGVHPEALRTWVKKAQVDGGLRPGTTTDQAQRIKELKEEVRELRRANAIP